MSSERSRLDTHYVNLMLFRLLEILYDSKGKGAKFRTCILGKEDVMAHFQGKGLTYSTEGWEKNRDVCRDFLKQMGIIENLQCRIEGKEIYVDVQFCIHYPMEAMLLSEEVPPYTCIPANLLALGIEKGAAKQTEMAKIEPGEKACKIKMLLFEDD